MSPSLFSNGIGPHEIFGLFSCVPLGVLYFDFGAALFLTLVNCFLTLSIVLLGLAREKGEWTHVIVHICLATTVAATVYVIFKALMGLR